MERKRRTPLMIASSHGSVDVLGYLLRVGADVSARSEDDERCTAMHCAASGGSALASEAIKLLLLFGADRAALDACGRVPADVLPGVTDGSSGSSSDTSHPRADSDADGRSESSGGSGNGDGGYGVGAAPRRRVSGRGRFFLVAGPGRGGASVGRVPNVRVQSASVYADASARLDRVSVHAPGGEGEKARSPAISLFRNGVSRVSKGVVSARRRVRIRARRVRVLAPSEQVPHATV